jgi:DNA polymerase-1
MIAKLVNASAISTILNTFLSGLPGKLRNGRVHTSLNINTETGRLSSQRPNLQNQPALEKDVYGVRKAFCAPPGRYP